MQHVGATLVSLLSVKVLAMNTTKASISSVVENVSPSIPGWDKRPNVLRTHDGHTGILPLRKLSALL